MQVLEKLNSQGVIYALHRKKENSMHYKKYDNHYTVEQYAGEDAVVSIPVAWEQLPVTGIEAKAFLSCKSIYELSLPDTIEEVGDWAFAHMKNLKVLHVPAKAISFGKHVFMGCEQLEQVCVQGDTSGNEGLSYLLASVLTILRDMTLFAPERAADALSCKSWMAEYDEGLLRFLDSPNDIGFEPVFFGWFDVEDIDVQHEAFVKERQKEKLRVVLLRLIYAWRLADDVKKPLQQYLLSYMPEEQRCREDSLLLELLREKYNQDVRYVKALADSGCITIQNISIIMEVLADGAPEVLAYLIQFQQSLGNGQDYFAELTL